MRRNDVDWIRVIALGLLIIYHSIVAFQPWGHKIWFIENEDHLEVLWIPMAMINVWRIPILFMVSGMGVFFAMRNRDWKQLLKERTSRILLPFVFGFFFICPINVYFPSLYFDEEIYYVPNVGHLWFLGNIFMYVLLLLPLLIYLNNRTPNFISRILTWLFQYRLGIIALALITMIEYLIVQPENFTIYAMTPHGFWLGMACFFIGFCLVSLGNTFWKAVEKARKSALGIGFSLYMIRLYAMISTQTQGAHWLNGFESMCWMLAIFGYGSLYLNKSSNALSYCKEAVYPVYIFHMPLQAFFSYLIMPLKLAAILKLVLLIGGIFAGSILLYEIVKQIKWFRPLFGLKLNSPNI
ncbi:MAG: acyltransferase [Candidatus Marinimicrobia bacterium]|nr:acyltransferase [Candidatus Neomarinimicrobiota bacterium]